MNVTTDFLRASIDNKYRKANRAIGRLKDTPMAATRILYHQLNIARQNELDECDMLDFLLTLSLDTLLTVLSELHSDLQWQAIYKPVIAKKTSKMIALVEMVI